SLTTSNFFRVAGLEIVEGRGFTEWDRTETQKVVVVDTTFAQGAWPGKSAVGQCLFFGGGSTDCTTVVGVVESALDRGLLDTDRAAIYYLPISQASSNPIQASFVNNMRTLIVRTRGNPGRVVQPTLLALADLFPDLPRDSVRSLQTVFAPRIRTWTIGTGLFGAAALLAVLLAAIGLYAVIAFGVRQRELEFGIRRGVAPPAHGARARLRAGGGRSRGRHTRRVVGGPIRRAAALRRPYSPRSAGIRRRGAGAPDHRGDGLVAARPPGRARRPSSSAGSRVTPPHGMLNAFDLEPPAAGHRA
ncbi:MAG: ABC transporter permease, partial [Acidobacteria bacterium]|nr:ABC transporter permease [Acidobacteriota bacterium]